MSRSINNYIRGEVNAETIQITILSDGVAFMNGDGIKRLMEVGAIGSKKSDTAKIGRAPRSQSQAVLLGKLKNVRTLERYRELVGDPRAEGLLHRFTHGEVVTLERNCDPRNPEIPVYCVLDTSIYASAAFITKLAQAKRIQVVQIKDESN